MEQKANKKRKRAEKVAQMKEAGLDPRAELPSGKDNPIYKLKRRKLEEIEFAEQKVVIDLGFDDQMSDKDIRSLVSQLTYLYGKNMTTTHPFQLYLTSFNGNTEKALLAHNGFDHWRGVSKEHRSYIDFFPKESLVYLSSESETSLDELNDKDVYIIGGLVDHNRLKGICHKKATEQGIRTARLPIDSFMDLKARKVLTINQVYEILLAFSVEKDWAKAFDAIIPKRKGGALLDATTDDPRAEIEPTDQDAVASEGEEEQTLVVAAQEAESSSAPTLSSSKGVQEPL